MKIVNFGSLNNDLVYSVEHFVKPGETVESEKLETFPGGKGLNQSIAAARAGAQVVHVGKIGPDGENLKAALRSEGVNADYIESSSLKSGHAVIQVEKSGQNSIILYTGANHDVGRPLIDRALASAGGDDLVLLQNEISNGPYIIQKAHERGLRVAFNPSPITAEILDYPLEYVHWFLLNQIEGQTLTGAGDPEEITRGLMEKYPGCAVILTLGKEGVLYDDGKTTARHGIYDVPCVDTTGAGDTFTGYFLAGVAAQRPIEECLRLASVASSIVVSRKGASPSIPTIREVLTANLPYKQ